MIEIATYKLENKKQVISLILGILEKEYNFRGISRPDIYNIEEVYSRGKSNFWVAIEGNEVVGTIALEDSKKNRGYLKRMYVKKEYRRKGVGGKLFKVVIDFAKKNNYKKIFLATSEALTAGNNFYVKNGFEKVKALPSDFPPNYLDMIFYKLDIKK